MLGKKSKDLGICLRCTATFSEGTMQKLTAAEVVEAHMEHAEKSVDGRVVWSTNVKVNASHINKIGKVVLFNDVEDFYVEADVEKIVAFKNEAIPDKTLVCNSWIPPQFPEPRKTWLVLTNLREVERRDLAKYEILNAAITLDEQVLRSRFSMVYFKKY